MTFFEVLWHGEGIGDGADFEEALASFVAVSLTKRKACPSAAIETGAMRGLV